jgi:hypothetical protein
VAGHREHPLTRRLRRPRRALAFVVNGVIMDPSSRESNISFRGLPDRQNRHFFSLLSA